MKYGRKGKKILKKQKINNDSVFLHHTGSMFGIGCSAFSKEAITKINSLKNRKDKSGYIVLIPDIEWLKRFNIQIKLGVHRILLQYWPGELSVVLEVTDPRLKHISQNSKVAFRIPTDELLRKYIIKLNQPILSTSVNMSGKEPVQSLDEILAEFENWFDFSILPEYIQSINNLPSTIIEFSNEKLNLIREESIPFSEIKLSYQSPQVLFVCSGNTCRSPIAEYLAKKIITEDDLKLRVTSAGFMADGMQISNNSNRVLALNGIDASDHVSTLMNEENLRESWLVLTMTKKHKNKILQLYPASASKVYTLSEYADSNNDIADPIGKDIEFYKKTFDEINEKVTIIFEKIKGER
ncbi:MAG: Sua5/YciO/YrdC/YwlC family protein [Candidatus Cloacimonetes bacterium]|jgi:tRNA threonylcarbamoyl adenosine modification protein (Sua5/YciO/YrdC/YwlC family)|nr:Sua5/YciO/YrdC/YwlC family protein [Candidatus Cloacimonadota bacterium]